LTKNIVNVLYKIIRKITIGKTGGQVSKKLIIAESEELKGKVMCIFTSIIACAYCQVKKIEKLETDEIYFKNVIFFKSILRKPELNGIEFDKIGIIFSNGREKISICKTENLIKNELKLANLNGFDKDSLLVELARIRISTLKEKDSQTRKQDVVRIIFYNGKSCLFEKKFEIVETKK